MQAYERACAKLHWLRTHARMHERNTHTADPAGVGWGGAVELQNCLLTPARVSLHGPNGRELRNICVEGGA